MAFVNADDIARALPEDFAGNRDIEAGRMLLSKIDELSSSGSSFALETTLSSRSLAARIRSLRTTGWSFRLVFVWVPTADVSVERVAARVRRGGHHIPEATIRRRYVAGLNNLWALYLPMADEWLIFQNAREEGPRLVANGGSGREPIVYDPDVWAIMKTSAP